MSDRKSQAERLMDIFVFVPAGLVQSATEEFDRLAEKGRHRVEGQIHTARLVGQFAVQTARGQAERLVGSAVHRLWSTREHVQDSDADSEASATRTADEGSNDPDPAGSTAWPKPSSGSSNGNAPGTHLAIPGYDSLSASQVVQRLDGLSHLELEEVKVHEQSNRHRRTILSRVDQLLSGEPSGQG